MSVKSLTVPQFRQYLTFYASAVITYNNSKTPYSTVCAYLIFDEIEILPSSPSTIFLKGKSGTLTINNVVSVKVEKTGIGVFITLNSKGYNNTEIHNLWIR